MEMIPVTAPQRPEDYRQVTLGVLIAAGGVLGLITAALPPSAGQSELVVVISAAFALIAAAGLVALRHRRLPEWVLALGVAFGTGLIALATWAGGFDENGTSDNAMLFLIPTLYSFMFLSLRMALVQMVVIGVAYTLLLVGTAAVDEAPTRFIVVTFSLLGTGLLVNRLRTWIEALIADLEARISLDPQTGVFNRRGLGDRARSEIARLRDDGEQIGFLLVDIDDFATYSRVSGQGLADQARAHVAATLDDATRPFDAVAHVSSDQFVVLLPGGGGEYVDTVANHLIHSLRASWDGAPQLTVSIGGASAPAEGLTLSDLWRSAERALEVAQRTGGDQARVTRDPIAASGL
jgi:diguanylate cyclase (GGDEF)-like protein